MKSLFTLFCLCSWMACSSLNAQILVATDELSFDFFGYNFNDESYIDYRLNAGGLAFDIYYAVTRGSDERYAYVSYLKYSLFGNHQPFIVKYDLLTKTHVNIVSAGIDEPNDMDVDDTNGKLYWIDMELDRMKRANLDGSNVEDLGEVEDFLTGWDPAISVDEVNGAIYFTEGGGIIKETSTNNWSPANFDTDFTVAGGRVGDLIVNDGYLYWTYNLTQEPSFIARQNLTTGVEEKIIVGADNSNRFNYASIYNNRIYWTGNGSVVSSATLDGNDQQMEFDAEPFIEDFILIEGTTTSTEFVEADELTLSVFPNPAKHALTINLGQEAADLNWSDQLSLVDMYGQILRQIPFAGNGQTIDISFLSPGIYGLLLQDATGRNYTKQFVKGW